MKKQEEKIEIYAGSDNIYKDIGFKNPGEMLRKAKIAIIINEILDERNLKQKKTAEILGIDQPKVSAIKNGRLKDFSIDRLLSFLNALNCNIKINITHKHKDRVTDCSHTLDYNQEIASGSL